MRILILFFLFLPVLEIAGFIIIGGKIGIGRSFLWLITSTMAGFAMLQARGSASWARARAAREDEIFAMSDLFDSICGLIGATLLIFPGFISDFLAIPFIIAPCRHWLFRRMKDDPDVFIRRYARKDSSAKSTVIEGEYRRTDADDKLPHD